MDTNIEFIHMCVCVSLCNGTKYVNHETFDALFVLRKKKRTEENVFFCSENYAVLCNYLNEVNKIALLKFRIWF